MKRTIALPAALLALTLALPGCTAPWQSSAKAQTTGAVTGGIHWCSALTEPPGYAPGRVIVTRGWTMPRGWHAIGRWYAHLRPISQTRVAKNQLYRFTLASGRYTLIAYETVSYRPVLQVTVKRGETLRADFPNDCI